MQALSTTTPRVKDTRRGHGHTFVSADTRPPVVKEHSSEVPGDSGGGVVRTVHYLSLVGIFQHHVGVLVEGPEDPHQVPPVAKDHLPFTVCRQRGQRQAAEGLKGGGGSGTRTRICLSSCSKREAAPGR